MIAHSSTRTRTTSSPPAAKISSVWLALERQMSAVNLATFEALVTRYKDAAYGSNAAWEARGIYGRLSRDEQAQAREMMDEVRNRDGLATFDLYDAVSDNAVKHALLVAMGH